MRARVSLGDAWLDALMAVLSIGSLTLLLLAALHPHTSTLAASDFKTLYGSAWCFAHGQDAYSETGIEAVFRADQTVLPESWFGHAPVYPPFTLALMTPLTALPMSAASKLWMVLSALLLLAATIALMRFGGEELSLPLWGRALIVILICVSPLTGAALALGNVSVATSALAILAFTRRHRQSPWVCGVLLAVALLLKPHVAIWIALGMLLLAEQAGRRIVLRASALATAFCVATATWLAVTGTLTLQTRSFVAIFGAEAGGGASMSPSSRAPLVAPVQITSLSSLVGFWTTNQKACAVLGWLLSLLAAVAIYRLTRSLTSERSRLLAVGACCALGMLATYHRAIDGVVLLILLPWALDRIRRPRPWQPWLAIALYSALTVGPHENQIAAWVATFPGDTVQALLLLRQAALAALLLLFVLLSALAGEHAERVRQAQP